MSQSKAIDGYFAFIFVACYLCDCRLSPTKSNKLYVILSIIKSIDETIIICQSHAGMNEA